MAFRNLSSEAMVEISSSWLDPERDRPDRRQLFLPVSDNYSCRLPPGRSFISSSDPISPIHLLGSLVTGPSLRRRPPQAA